MPFTGSRSLVVNEGEEGMSPLRIWLLTDMSYCIFLVGAVVAQNKKKEITQSEGRQHGIVT